MKSFVDFRYHKTSSFFNSDFSDIWITFLFTWRRPTIAALNSLLTNCPRTIQQQILNSHAGVVFAVKCSYKGGVKAEEPLKSYLGSKKVGPVLLLKKERSRPVDHSTLIYKGTRNTAPQKILNSQAMQVAFVKTQMFL